MEPWMIVLKFLIVLQLFVTSLVRSEHVYTSYQGSIYCNAARPLQFPKNINEVQIIVKEAIRNNLTVKALGYRHSVSDVICTEGVPIAMENIKYMIYNSDDTVTVGAGVAMKTVLDFLQEKGRSLIHMTQYSGLTAGGLIGTGAHGSSLRHTTTLSDQAIKFTVVDGKGEIRIVDDEEDLKAFRVHLGLLGVIVDITLKTVPLFKMTVENIVESEEILLDGTAIENAKKYDYYMLMWSPFTKSVVSHNGEYIYDVTILGNAWSTLLEDFTADGAKKIHDVFETMHRNGDRKAIYSLEETFMEGLHSKVEGRKPFYTEDGKTMANPATGFAANLYSSFCKPGECIWDFGNNSLKYEEHSLAFALSEFTGVISKIKNILSHVSATFPLFGLIFRFCKASDSFMAIENERDTVHLEWLIAMREDPFETSKYDIGTYQAILQAILNEHGGRSHWGKTGLHYHSKDVLSKTVKNLEPFKKVMKDYDPNGIFMNKFGRRLTRESSEIDTHPLMKHCALEDYCVCQKDTDCASNQVCETILDKYNICKESVPELKSQRKAANDNIHMEL